MAELNKTAMLNAELEGTKRDLVQMEVKYQNAVLFAILFGIASVSTAAVLLYMVLVNL